MFSNFILVKNSTIFGQTYWLSSGILILHSQQLVFVKFVNAQPVKQTYQYKNTKENLYKTNAAIWHNKIYRKIASNVTNTICCE
jgi:hypothetical protein